MGCKEFSLKKKKKNSRNIAIILGRMCIAFIILIVKDKHSDPPVPHELSMDSNRASVFLLF